MVIITTCILTFHNLVSVEAFMAIASAIITYYFTKVDEKIQQVKEQKNNNDEG